MAYVSNPQFTDTSGYAQSGGQYYSPQFQQFNTAVAPAPGIQGLGGSPWGGYFAPFASGGGNAYNGMGMSMQGPYVGYAQAPGAGAANARNLQNQYINAYNQAKQANLQRFQEIGGFNNPLSSLPMRTVPAGGSGALSGIPGVGRGKGGIQQVQIGGKWKPLDQVTPADTQAINQMVARNSQFEPMQGGYYGRYARGTSAVGDMTGQQNAGYNALVGGYQGLANQYTPWAAQYGNRLNTGMGLIANAGQQQAKDINERYNALQSAEHNNLIARGMTASTVGSSVANSVERERTRALGELNDQLLQQQYGAYSSLSGQQLGAQQQALQAQQMPLTAQQQMLANQYKLGELGLQTDTGLSGDLLNFSERRNDPYPNLQTMASLQQGLGYGAGYGLPQVGSGQWGQMGPMGGAGSYYG